MALAAAFVFTPDSFAADASLAGNPRVTGSPPLRVWRTEEHGASSINWRIVAHPVTGFIYAANNAGILEFDGVRWRVTPLPHGNPARTVLLGPDGRIWGGGRSEFAALEPDAHGELHAVDYTSRLPADLRPAAGEDAAADAASDDDASAATGPAFIAATNAIATPDGPVLMLRNDFLRLRADGNFDRWPKGGVSTNLPWWSDGAVHFVLRDTGTVRFDGKDFVPVPGTREPRVLDTIPDRTGGWLWLTTSGPVRWSGGVARNLASPEAVALFRTDRPRCAVALSDGRTAFGTTNNGVVLLDPEGRLEQIIDRTRGLPANRVNGIAVDAADGLWLAMHVGIVRIELGAPLSRHGEAQGLPGSPRRLVRAGSRLFVTHGEGFSARDDRTGRFESVAGFTAGTHQIAVRDEDVLVTGLGVFALRPDAMAAVDVAGVPRLYRYGIEFAAGWPDLVFVGTALQVAPWQRQPAADDGAPRWKIVAPFDQMPSGAEHLYSDTRKFLWAVGRDSRVRRVDLRAGVVASAPVETYGPAQGLPAMVLSDRPDLLPLGEDLLVTSRRGVFRYDAIANRFARETRFGEGAADGPIACAPSAHGAWMYFDRPVPRLVHWAITPQGWRATEHSLSGFGSLIVNSIYPDERTRTLWLAAQGQLVALDMDWRTNAPRPPLQAILRRVLSSDGALLWAPPAYQRPPSPAQLVLPPERRAIRVELAAPEYAGDLQGRDMLQFRTRAEHIDASWTPWTDEPQRDLTNLPDGPLAFEVQVRDASGRTSAPAQLALTILPPWWRTTTARVGWGALGLAFVSGFVWVRTRTLRRRNEHLETVVATRTAELARLRQIDRDESVASKLAEEKTRLEMLRYQLNPHFLYNALNSIRALVFTKPPAAGDMVSQLAELCRVTLTRNEDSAPVSEEFAMLKLYLDMEKTRWRDKLAIEINLAPDAASQSIPPFLLLPLVENALKHGRQTTTGVMTLRLGARVETDGALILEVANSGTWVEPGQSFAPSTGIGLENLRQRLKRYYPDRHELTTTPADGWVIVKLRLTA